MPEHDSFSTIFNGLFNGSVAPTATREERDKATALINVVAKSTASLSDVVRLADALDLNLSLYATPKPKPKTEETEATK